MIQTTDAPGQVLDDIVRRLVEQFHPSRIILLFGSRARGDAGPESDYDVMVEVDATAPRSRPELIADASRLWRAGIGPPVDVKFQTPDVYDVRRDDPGTVEWDVEREGVLLYAATGASQRPPREVRERPRSTDSADEMIDSAETDREAIAVLAASERPLWPAVAFHAQQTAENYLKALLIRCLVRPPRTHDLSELLAAVRAAGVGLTGADADCKLLTPHAIKVRHAGDTVDERAGRDAAAAAERIATAVQHELEQGGLEAPPEE